MIEISPLFLGLIPLVVGLVQIAKLYIGNSNHAPLLSLIFGIALSFLVSDLNIPFTIISGIVVGLSASGLYSGAKKTLL